MVNNNSRKKRELPNGKWENPGAGGCFK